MRMLTLDDMPSPMEDEGARTTEDRMAERRRKEAERRRIEAERWRVEPEREAMAEKVEAERESRMEKAEEESERRQMPSRRWGRRVDICEERMEGEASRAESEREAKKLELERDLDSQTMESEVQRREAEVAEVQRREAEAQRREAMIEKAEEEAERMKPRRRRPSRRWGRRVKMGEERLEAEVSRAELERVAKKLELELERDLDSQRMEAEVQSSEAEVAEAERWLAKFRLEQAKMKAEMEAEEKWMEKCEIIFKVWWGAWLQAEQQEYHEGKGEDREIWSVRRPSSVMAVWELWKSENDDLFIELSNSVSLEKANELLWNNWRKKVDIGTRTFLREMEDTVLMPYCSKYIDFRSYWESKYGDRHGQFEDITKMRCMKFTCGNVPRYVFKGPRPTTLQIFSACIGGLCLPLQVYGLIALRDFVDPQRNMIFNRHREDCHIVTEEDPYLPLSGPTRSVVVDMNEIMGPVTIEAELKVKGAVESEDKYIILDFISLPSLGGSSVFELAGPHMRLRISLGAVQKSVEANIFIRVVDGTWPTGFHGRFVANTGIDCSEVILLEFSGDGEMKQSRHVVSVEASGTLVVTLKAWEGEEVGSVIFNAVDRGRSFETLNVGSCSVQVIVAWSLIYPYRQELVPLRYKKLFNYRHANESSWE